MRGRTQIVTIHRAQWKKGRRGGRNAFGWMHSTKATTTTTGKTGNILIEGSEGMWMITKSNKSSQLPST